ncbi:ABC-three component system protein [uncultured Microbacterium sp.]|uniref:ABC-three component system protein n=1 Tax=uncultured Microbacterium sp. TaxID=191216 RepID=UPI00262204D4|nr:ABC-three component system protein [uncultured Microbacterium sp.]
MFLSVLTSSDPRFKTLRFREGLNILVADRTETSEQGDSRNSIGKTSAVKILRYVLGGDLPSEFKAPELSEHTFTATLSLPTIEGDGADEVTVARAVSPTTRVRVSGWSATNGAVDLHIDEWRELLSREVFRIPEHASRPTAGQIWGQLIRTYFGNPIKGHQSEADWESGVKIGFMLGLSPEILGKAGEVDRLTKQGKAIRAAVREGAIAHLSLDESALRAQLATARRQRDRTQGDLRSFKVDEQYADHQHEADSLSGSIQRLNDEGLALQRRLRELDEALQDEVASAQNSDLAMRLGRVYAEIGLVLPDTVSKRYEEVQAFHESVVRNRRSFLEQELGAVRIRLEAIDAERRNLDAQRSQIMQLLNETVALDTFLSLQRDLAKQESDVADIERRLEAANSISTISDTIKLRTAELVASVRTELNERDDRLDESISLFSELGAEIYTDREAALLVAPTAKGLLSVGPRISGDASTGVRSVETFMLDIVCTIAAIKLGRAPRILVHDSHLFDAIDGRQVASCLNIGARLAEEHGFQYIVTLNSDFLTSVEAQSDGAFDAEPYMLGTRLTDETEAGGLFGFRFG